MDYIEGAVLYFDKPFGWTSFDLVNRVRRLLCRHLGIKTLKVGHAGTLDPLATGVMILCTGRATKQIDQWQAKQKEYIATLALGATTPSFDLELPIDAVFETGHITRELVIDTLKKFTGEIRQTPPIYSAVKVNGKRAFDYARRNDTVTLEPKLLVIDEIELLSFDMPNLTFRVVCSKGTYIRALARDIGMALGSGAHLTALKRTKIGSVTLEDCLSTDEFTKQIQETV
ncbi:MAG: tRNA pseudouridine(55) synthase TruB [Prevotellaceae bacterium]|jgi:tRNA pseudouridine55 synthase|nr:tRNA pseudouridine(55) synthase TruB [Prevotellaceae bacterium]